MSSVLIVHEVALNTAVHKTTRTNVLCNTKQTDFNNKVTGITIKEKKSPRKCLQTGPLFELLGHPPWRCLPVGYNLQMWQAKEGSGSGLENCSPSHYSSRQHYTQPGIKATNIKDAQLLHCPHLEKSAGVFMRKAAGLSRTVCS